MSLVSKRKYDDDDTQATAPPSKTRKMTASQTTCEHCRKVLAPASLKRHQNSSAKCLKIQGKSSACIGKPGHCTVCGKRANYGLTWKKPMHCKVHAIDGEEDVVSKRCAQSGCKTQPSFGRPGERPIHCSVHAKDGEEDVRNRRCIHPDCKTIPIYGHPGQRPIHCSVHATDGEEDIVNKRCVYPGCKRLPSYGRVNEQLIHCHEHVEDGEEYRADKRCIHPDCKTQPNYGLPGERPIHCRVHAQDGEENVASKRCNHSGCKTQPNYGLPGGQPIHCRVHAKDGEENVTSKRCEHPGCKTQPSYGLPDNLPTHCREHAVEGEEEVRSKKCEYAECKTQATYGPPGGRPIHCFQHVVEGEEDVCSKRCSYHDCKTRAVADGFCTIHHMDYIPASRVASKIGCEFIDCIAAELGLTKVQHIHYDKISKSATGSEFRIPTTRYRADGFFHAHDTKKKLPFTASSKGIVLEFHGHLRHGYPNGEKEDKCNYNGAKFGDLYKQTMQRMSEINKLGYTVLYIWENDFHKWKKHHAGQPLFQHCHVL